MPNRATDNPEWNEWTPDEPQFITAGASIASNWLALHPGMVVVPLVETPAPVVVVAPASDASKWPAPSARRMEGHLNYYNAPQLRWCASLIGRAKDVNLTAVHTGAPRLPGYGAGYGEPVKFTLQDVMDRLNVCATLIDTIHKQTPVTWSLRQAATQYGNSVVNAGHILRDLAYSLQGADTGCPMWSVLMGRYDLSGSLPSHALEVSNGGEALRAFNFPFREREEMRFHSGYYVNVPWNADLTAIEDHYVHLDPSDSSKVRYTPDAAKGERHVYVSCKPGRYLTKFYKDVLSPVAITEWQAKVDLGNALQVTTTSDECVDVYKNGPSSCMAGGHSFDGKEHPAAVYGGEGADLQVAYMTKVDGKGYSSRAVVWPSKKLYSRIYGDTVRMKQKLELAGYVAGRITGAKVRVIYNNKRKDNIVMPYIDDVGNFTMSDDGLHAILDDRGPYDCRNTCGTAALKPMCQCYNCGEQVSDDDTRDVDGDTYCTSCAENCNYCERTGNHTREDVVTVNTSVRNSATRFVCYTEQWAESEADENAFHCEGSDEYYALRRFTSCEMANGETWCVAYFEANGGVIGYDGKRYSEDDAEAMAEKRSTPRVDPVWSVEYRATQGAQA